MKFTKNTPLLIVKDKKYSFFHKPSHLDYSKWVDYIDSHKNIFVWREETSLGHSIMNNINEYSPEIKIRVLRSLNKLACYFHFNPKGKHYFVNINFDPDENIIFIGFERKPNKNDLLILLDMANHLDANLLYGHTKIINKEVIDSLDL